MDIGIKFVSFQYHYHCCVLLRSHTKWRHNCIEHSREALSLLADLVSDSNEVYNSVIWALLYCSFTPFFVLFGDVLSKGDGTTKQLSLDAMEKLPAFMEKMSPRHSQAGKLYHISMSLVQQAKSILADKQEPEQVDDPVDAGTPSPRRARTDPLSMPAAAEAPGAHGPVMSEMFDPTSFMDFFNEPVMPQTADTSNYWTPNSVQPDTAYPDPSACISGTLPQDMDLSDMFMQSNFDWFAWDSNAFGFDNSYRPF